MKAQLKKLSGKYIAMLQEMKLEVAQRKVVTIALRKIERHYAQLLEESYGMQEQLRHLSRQILLAHEEERKKISRELHDEIGQILAGVNVRLAALKSETGNNAKNLNKKIVATQRLVEKSMQTIHQFARELRPAVLDDIGLIPALHSYMKEFTQRTRIPIRFEAIAFAKLKELNSLQRTSFFRVAQEGLNNVAKHAKASLVKVSLKKREGVICMEIKDNGKSFSVKRMMRTGRRKRLGLLGMKERMEMIGGSCNIESLPGKGTTLFARAPVIIPQGVGQPQAQKVFL